MGAYENAGALPPFAADDMYNTSENATLSVAAPGVLSNDSDGKGDVITPTLQTGPANGMLVFSNDGSFVYTPTLNFSELDSFTYVISDGVLSDTAVVTITVNDAPLATGDVYTTTEDVLLMIVTPGVLSNDSDVNGDDLTAVLDTNVTTGTLTFNNDGSFVYTPTLNFCGTDNFTYHANDGHADSATAAVVLTITCVNDVPVAADDSYSVLEDSNDNMLNVLVNDTDVDGDALSLTAVTTPSNGTAIISGTLILYTPAASFVGSDVITYTVSDGALTDTAVVTISVDNENDGPTAVDDAYSVSEDSSDNVLDVLANDSDIDVGDVLSVTAVFFPSNGTATISGTAVLYTPVPDFFGTDVFSYTVSDGALTDTAVVTVTVVNINDGPTAVDDVYTVDENSSDNMFAALANDSDVDGDSLSIVSVDGAGNGTAVISGTNIFYTPNPDFVGTDTFTYTVSDGNLTAVATINVTVMPVQTDVIVYLPFVTKP
jgi:VCBS repeat-containing protein